MKKDQVLGIIRHLLTTVGGFVGAKGWLSDDLITEVSAGVLIVIGTIWSIVTKMKKEVNDK